MKNKTVSIIVILSKGHLAPYKSGPYTVCVFVGGEAQSLIQTKYFETFHMKKKTDNNLSSNCFIDPNINS